MKKQLKQETALKHWMVIGYDVCLIHVEYDTLLNVFDLEWIKEGFEINHRTKTVIVISYRPYFI